VSVQKQLTEACPNQTNVQTVYISERMGGTSRYHSAINWTQTYQPSSNPWKFSNIKSSGEDGFYSHLEVRWLSKAYPQTTKKRPIGKKLHSNQDLKKKA